MSEILTDLLRLRRVKDEFIEQIDRVLHNNNYNITRNNADSAKLKIESALHLITGDDDLIGKLSAKDLSRIVNLVTDVVDGRRKVVQFMRVEGAIEEVITGKIFPFE
jgi:hypothetical protein